MVSYSLSYTKITTAGEWGNAVNCHLQLRLLVYFEHIISSDNNQACNYFLTDTFPQNIYKNVQLL